MAAAVVVAKTVLRDNSSAGMVRHKDMNGFIEQPLSASYCTVSGVWGGELYSLHNSSPYFILASMRTDQQLWLLKA